METSACSYSFIRITSSQVVAKEALKTLCRMQPNVCAMVSLPPTLEQGKCRPYPGMRNEPVNMCTLLSIFGPFVTRRGGSSADRVPQLTPPPAKTISRTRCLIFASSSALHGRLKMRDISKRACPEVIGGVNGEVKTNFRPTTLCSAGL